MDLPELSERLSARLDAATAAREKGLASSREAIRFCGNAIRALHRYENDVARQLLDDAQARIDAARTALKDFPDLLNAGFIHDAEKELAEGRITYALALSYGVLMYEARRRRVEQWRKVRHLARHPLSAPSPAWSELDEEPIAL